MTTAPVATAHASGHSTRWVAAWCVPPVLWVITRRCLAWLDERAPAPSAWLLQPFQGQQTGWELLMPGVGLMVALGVLVVILIMTLRRYGAVRAGRYWVALWAVLWLLAAGREVQSFQTVRQLAEQEAPLEAKVLGHRVQAPSLRSPGGVLVVLQLQGASDATRQVLLPSSAGASQWTTGVTLRLQVAQDRAGRHWVRRWHLAKDVALPQS